MRQIDEVRVCVVTYLSQIFTLNLAGTEIRGSSVRGQVSQSYTGTLLNLLVTEEFAEAKCPSYEFVRLIADVCEIKDPNHYSLLHTALSSSSMESIFSTFAQQGIYISGLVLGVSYKFKSYPKADLWT
jgi:hypothetical protein